ncbi:5-formyltetrahydrofolate cyclo-ligase-like protein [Lophium mytilinum]|uniref:5-formyltetrahydrofolate cyclo-ligase n=1 Tax=Lophium mytilinum TaxID=390894 RepID=A0A6A6QBA6_9PEZI|nr:5-formyltetrahydrofolate cyclo-ligase-like protein [Lophium mytilinum]
MAALKNLKKELRQRIKLVLAGLSQESITSQTSNAVETLLSMPEYKAAKRISIYLSMPSGEISTSGIVHDALKEGKRVFIPYTYKMGNPREGQPKSIMDMLELTSMNDFASLKPDGWGIPSLDKDSISDRENSFGGKGLTDGTLEGLNEADSGLDFIVMPGMAFDSSFGRLGHGKGFYDFFLERCQTHSTETSARKPFLVGLALAEQLLTAKEFVPMDTTDWRLDALVLGTGQLLRRDDPS